MCNMQPVRACRRNWGAPATIPEQDGWRDRTGTKEALQVSTRFSESVVEDAALAWPESLRCVVLHAPNIAAGEFVAGQTMGRCA
jgi:hypothetical protein